MDMDMDLHGLLLLPLSAAFFALLLTVRTLLLHNSPCDALPSPAAKY
jgi:hypothetical protein